MSYQKYIKIFPNIQSGLVECLEILNFKEVTPIEGGDFWSVLLHFQKMSSNKHKCKCSLESEYHRLFFSFEKNNLGFSFEKIFYNEGLCDFWIYGKSKRINNLYLELKQWERID